MEMNATDMLYEKMAYELAYGDMMAYGPAQLSSPISERFGGAEFVGYEQHGGNNSSFEQGVTLHGTRYSDSSPLPSDFATDGLKTLKSPNDLVQRMNYGLADMADKSSIGSGHMGRATFGSDNLTKNAVIVSPTWGELLGEGRNALLVLQADVRGWGEVGRAGRGGKGGEP